MADAAEGRDRIAILLSTHNGEAFLAEQLDSLLAQTHCDWVLYWRDDASTDASAAVLRRFASGPGRGRVVELQAPAGRIGPTQSFLALLRHVAADGARAVAFADQDDVWLPEKLACGLAALRTVPGSVPALYCARQVLVDERLRRIGLSEMPRREVGFLPALTQNIATGCTVLLNREAARLVAASHPPPDTLHDWWSYLLVAGAGGRLLIDGTPVVLYRQHAGNLVGATPSLPRRALRALRRGPGAYMKVLRQHVAALIEQPELIGEEAQAQLLVLAGALGGGGPGRLAALTLPGLRRQTVLETLVFRLWFLIG